MKRLVNFNTSSKAAGRSMSDLHIAGGSHTQNHVQAQRCKTLSFRLKTNLFERWQTHEDHGTQSYCSRMQVHKVVKLQAPGNTRHTISAAISWLVLVRLF